MSKRKWRSMYRRYLFSYTFEVVAPVRLHPADRAG